MTRADHIERYARLRKAHAPRQHEFEKLKWATVHQLQEECPAETERDWPTAAGVVLHELAHLAAACAVVGIVLAIAAIYSGVK